MVVAVLLGSVRSDRLGGKVAAWVVKELEKRGHEAVLVDAMELELPVLDRMWKEVKEEEPGGEHAALRAKLEPLAKLYERADGFAIVSAEYNHTAPPGLVNLIDYFLEEYFYRPSAIICYSASAFGGVRAAIGLRALLAEVGMGSIPTLQPVPLAGSAVSEGGVALTQELAEKSGKFYDEFEWYMKALGAQRRIGVPGAGK